MGNVLQRTYPTSPYVEPLLVEILEGPHLLDGEGTIELVGVFPNLTRHHPHREFIVEVEHRNGSTTTWIFKQRDVAAAFYAKVVADRSRLWPR